MTPDRFSLNQQKESEYEQPSQFILGQGQLSLQPAEKTDGQLSRNQPQDLSTASKKLDDGSQKDGSPRQTPSPRDKSRLEDPR